MSTFQCGVHYCNLRGSARQRIGVMYMLPTMAFRANLSTHMLGVSGSPLSGPWAFRQTSTEVGRPHVQDERFPAILVNLLVSVRFVQ